jgi:hypothetical protein
VRDRAVLVVFGAALVVLPIYVLVTDDHAPLYDALRTFVLVQAGIVFCLMSYTFGWVCDRLVKASRMHDVKPDASAAAIVAGSMTRNFGILIMLIIGVLGTVGRIGNEHLDWRTPMFQAALLCFFYGWALVDRRIYRTTKTPQELVGGLVVQEAVEHAHEIAKKAGVEDSLEAFRSQSEDRRKKNGG